MTYNGSFHVQYSALKLSIMSDSNCTKPTHVRVFKQIGIYLIGITTI